jgi:chain length determinant protein tyrosine kinase EpsG
MKQLGTTAAAGDTPMPSRDRSRAFGAILIEQGRLNPADAEEIQRYAGANGMRFGDAAIRLKLLTQEDIDFALAQQYNYPILPRGGASGVSDDVVAAYMPQNDAVEPLRVLRSQLTHRWFNDTTHKALAVTSPSREEGRSWLAANLATVFAQIGERTLLIDADMRHPRQHALFNLNNTVGLSALLTGRAGKEAACRIHPQLRLFVLPAGILPPNPQELLGRPVFDLVLERFSDQFDIIIIDTPAATETADAQIVAKRVGGALMVARRNLTRQAQLTSATQSLVQTGVTVVGSVFNEF